MAIKGIKRPERTHTRPHNQADPTPELQGKAKHGTERPIPADVYPAIDTDLARDNLENDIPSADLNELQ